MASTTGLISPGQPAATQPSHQQRWRRCWLLFCSLTVLTLVGCDRVETSTRVESVGTTNQRVERSLRGESLASTQAPISLRLPRNWQSVPGNALHPTADLQAYNPEAEIYLVVVGEQQANVTAAADLNQQAQIYIQLLKGGLNRLIANASLTEVTSVNGFDAVQYEVQGEVLGTEVAYLHTTVEINGQYYQIAWRGRPATASSPILRP
jgi:hypothetical protein